MRFMATEEAIASAEGRLQYARDELEELTEEYEEGEWTPGERAEWIEDLDFARRSVMIEEERLTSLRQQAATQ